jgi:hypothetical protein
MNHSIRTIRAHLRYKYGARQYRISYKTFEASCHARVNGRWVLVGYLDDPLFPYVIGLEPTP